jgi:hypothetical protein
MLPQWMKMAKDPNSVGAQFLNAFGLEFEDVRIYLDNAMGDQYIDTTDLSQVDITYKVPVALPTVLDFQLIDNVVGNKGAVSYTIEVVTSLKDFYLSSEDKDVCVIDRTEGLIYIRPRKDLVIADKFVPYDSVNINEVTHYDLILHHVWNAFDEFGMLMGLQRLYGERNEDFKTRILDVFKNPGNATQSGLLNALSREFGIAKTDIQVKELGDKAYKDSLLNDDGSPTAKLSGYVDRINKLLSFTWDNMSWGEAYWKSVEEANIGFDYLPHVWDASMLPWLSEEFQSGIGDGDDLLVRAPEKQDNTRNFNYYVGVRGVIKDGNLISPEHSFKYKITAHGTILNQEYKPENYKYTVIGSEIINLYFIIKGYQKYIHTDTIDFTNLTGFKYDNPTSPNIEIVDGNVMLSPVSNQHLELEVYMKTNDPTKTPSLSVLSVLWQDAGGIDRTFTMDTQTDFDRNDPTVVTDKQNVISTVTGEVELGFGDFYHMIDTEGDWKKGTSLNVEIMPTGSIQLIRPII